MVMMGEARAISADSRGAEAGVVSSRARETRVRPEGAGSRHMTARPVADPPSLINSEPVPRRCAARFGCGCR